MIYFVFTTFRLSLFAISYVCISCRLYDSFVVLGRAYQNLQQLNVEVSSAYIDTLE